MEGKGCGKSEEAGGHVFEPYVSTTEEGALRSSRSFLDLLSLAILLKVQSRSKKACNTPFQIEVNNIKKMIHERTK